MERILLGREGLMRRSAIFSLVLAIFVSVPASAVTSRIHGLALSPPRTEYTIAPGESKKHLLTITNGTDTALNVGLDAEQFSVTDQQYNYAFKSGTDVSKWVSFSRDKLPLGPNDQYGVDVTINVPKSAEPGGYYISLFATTDAGADGGGINSIQRIASLLYVTVGGKVSRVGSLKSFDSPQLFDGYNQWKMVVANRGTSHFHSDYSISVRNILTDQEVANASGSALILPNTTRLITGKIPAPHFIGIYKVVYRVGLGDAPAASRESYMIFLPRQAYVPLMALSVIAGGGSIYALIRLRHRRVNDSR